MFVFTLPVLDLIALAIFVPFVICVVIGATLARKGQGAAAGPRDSSFIED